MWYDRFSIVPGYQDSYGDDLNFPVGMRPNTIDSGLIAVPGGHGWIFAEAGIFHFPFGRPGGAGEDAFVVNFWHVPRDGGALLPVVWWWREPTSWHHRIEWMFPKGTVTGEVLFKVTESGAWYPFEIRTRVRRLDGWTSDAFRPFPTAESLALALEGTKSTAPDVAALVVALRDPGTLQAGQLRATHFEGSSFLDVNGAQDELPGLDDPAILMELLMETPFVSARGAAWKSSGGMTAWAATTQASFSIVPRGYNAGFIAVDDASCGGCHRDAGRPFRDFYPDIMLYGELWGEDEVFSWHPFLNESFVDGDGDVVGFGPPDNRELRPDLEPAGLLAPYRPADHGADLWRKPDAPWRDYVYD
jgi:hypothetical protein